jgi:hypothetical protein
MGLAGEADALSVFRAPVFDVEGRDLDGMVEALEISRAACAPFFGRKRVRKTDAARVTRTLASSSTPVATATARNVRNPRPDRGSPSGKPIGCRRASSAAFSCYLELSPIETECALICVGGRVRRADLQNSRNQTDTSVDIDRPGLP